jgi:hypothetical protein
MNPFIMLHTERSGKMQPIISMDADHLVNMVNLVLIKNIRKAKESAAAQLLGKYAPEGMSDKQRIALGLKKATEQAQEKAKEHLDELELEMIQAVFEKFWPYILVGLCRDDTRNGVLAILQDATDISGRIDLPGMFTNSILSDEDLFELSDGMDEDWGDRD